jgi:predicted DsbA family dithiol-disulfide isomerase
MFDEAGLPHATILEKVPNSRGALMVGELGRDRGVHDAIHPRLFDAFWARGLDIGDEAILVAEGTAAGLDPEDITTVLRDQRYLSRIEDQTQGAISLGAGGVPAWVIDERLLVPGAQPHEVFDRVMEQLGYEPVEPAERPSAAD